MAKFAKDLMLDVFQLLTARRNSEQPLGVTTGFEELDELLGGGLPRQRLSYLLGDSGVGKSYIASWMVLEAAGKLAENPEKNRPMSGYMLTGLDEKLQQQVGEKTGKPPVILMWNLEMDAVSVVTRMLAQVAAKDSGVAIDTKLLVKGWVDTDEESQEGQIKLAAFRRAHQKMYQTLGNHLVIECDTKNLMDLRAILQELSMTYDVCLVICDYFRFIDDPSSGDGRVERQEQRSAALKRIALEFDCHVMGIFDINREGQRAIQSGSKPTQYDMRDGTAAHYDADYVLALYYKPGEKTASGESSEQMQNHLVLEVQKARMASRGSVELHLDPICGKFEPWFRHNPSAAMSIGADFFLQEEEEAGNGKA